ncbi:hypothetical protein BRARA_G00368, partial [Brassica rapa]
SNRPSLLNGRNGGVLVLELSSEVLSANSDVFAGLIAEKSPGLTCRMEISDVENLGVFKETVELMFEEEERLRRVLALYNLDDAATEEILARFNSNETENTQENLSKQLVWSITSCSDTNPRNQLKSLVNGILCKSSVYEKEQPEINKEDIYKAGKYCVDSLVKLFEEGSISREGENIIWLLEIMIDWEIAEEFVEIWGKERKLVEMHEEASPMVRYELSIVIGSMFIEIGKWRVQCGGEARAGLVDMWFKPMLLDFGWLQMGKKGLYMREKHYPVFMECFRWFCKNGTECPNLGKAFQIRWRRPFLRGADSSSTCR